MSEERNDGGPAFPVPGYAATGREVVAELGMTLRDWFAGQALVGVLLEYGNGAANVNLVAEVCYTQADAMLERRVK